MATYEFKCHCGEKKEIISPVTLGRVMLPACKCGRRMRRVFSPPALLFKGSGFYSTDKAR